LNEDIHTQIKDHVVIDAALSFTTDRLIQ